MKKPQSKKLIDRFLRSEGNWWLLPLQSDASPLCPWRAIYRESKGIIVPFEDIETDWTESVWIWKVALLRGYNSFRGARKWQIGWSFRYVMILSISLIDSPWSTYSFQESQEIAAITRHIWILIGFDQIGSNLIRRFDWSKVDHIRLISELPALKLIAELEAILSEVRKEGFRRSYQLAS